MILRIRPDLVGEISNLETVASDFGYSPAFRGWITKDRSSAGHIGSPQAASVEKGEHLFSTFSDGVVALLQQVIDWDGSSFPQ